MRTLELHAHAKQVKRSSGRSSVAAAAYRSASRMVDERTGETHDYSNKQGVEYTRIYAPDHAPVWAQDREALWNAAEAKENRKNSCTAHELEVSFPHEFNPMQRREAGDSIAREIMKRYGCAVDIAYHRPTGYTDDRNFHAHILFTTRGFDPATADGWSKTKYRDLASDMIRDPEGNTTTRGKQEIASLREFTAGEMNRIAERDRLPVRTEHLSFEARGIDREPTQKMGATATRLEREDIRSGTEETRSRIANENRAVDDRNRERAEFYMKAIAEEKAKAREQAQFRDWLDRKPKELDAAQALTRHDLDSRHAHQRTLLQDRLDKHYHTAKAALNAELQAVNRRLDATGLKRLIRDVTFKTRGDKKTRESLLASLADIKTREAEQRNALSRQQTQDRKNLEGRQADQKRRQAEGLAKAEKNKEIEWERRTVQGTWNEKVRKVDLLPTDRQAKILSDRDYDPKEFNRVTAAQEIDRIAEAEGWNRRKDTAPDPQPSSDPQRKEDLQPKPVNRGRRSLDERFREAKAPKALPARSTAPEPAPEPSERLSLDDRKRISDVHINEGDRNKLERGFERASLSERKARYDRSRKDKPKAEKKPDRGRKPE